MGCGYILAIVIVIHMVPNYEAKDFCHSYRENGFKVDFDYQNVISDTNGRLYIGSDYWKVSENLSFDRNQSRSSDWIRKNQNNYRIFFGVNDSFVNTRGMWRKNVNTIDWLNYKPIVLNNTDFEPSFSFIFTSMLIDHDLAIFNCFGEQSPLLKEPNMFRRRYECYYFATSSGIMSFVNETTNVSLISLKMERKKSGDTDNQNNSLNGVIGRHQIITMFRRKDVGTGDWSFVILYQINQTIHYCLTKFQLFVDECEDLKELVDCSSNSDNSDSTDKTDNILLIIAIISIIVVIIVVFLCIFCGQMKSKKKKSSTIKESTSESTSDSELSSSATSSIIPSTSSVNGTHSQLFSVQSNVDYTKPILLKPPNSSSSEVSVLKA